MDNTMMEPENELGNLESLLGPISYGQEYPLPQDIPGKPTLPTGVHFNGHMSNSCEWGWVYSQTVIRCFPLPVTDDSIRKGPLAVCPEPYQFPMDCFITCATELLLHNPKTTNGVSRLVIGLNFRNSEGGLVIFDPLRAQPVKLIMLPAPVTSITVISHFEDSGFNSHFFNEAMMAMVGVVSVGLQSGQVIILDLGLDQLPHSSLFYYKNVFAKRPYKPVFVSPHEPSIALKRHHWIAEKKVIALRVINESLDDNEMDTTGFHFCRPDRTTIKTFSRRNVRVTALEYIAPIGLLIVGFDFGGIQIWRVDTLQLVYTSCIPPRPYNGVFGFSFSQPVDDPKNYCYLWVMYGKPGLEMGHSHVELYCLEFQDKPVVGNLGCIYKGFIQCIKKLDFKLEDFYDDVGEDNAEGRYYVRPLKIWNSPGSSNGDLTFFSWESARMGVYYVGIFDLNQWYSNRMMENLRFSPLNGLCPYWVAIPVETTDQYRAIPMCDVQIIPRTLERWNNPHCTLDLHLYPASLSFEAFALSQSASSTFQFFGVQEKLLRKLIEDGTNLMIQPASMKKMFRAYGLRPILPLQFDSNMPKDMADRFYIFSALLDNRRLALIIQFAASWLDGAYANVGCTVDLILSWISAYTCSLRVIAKDHWAALHRHDLEFLAPETQHFIHYSNFVWESLLAVFNTITRPDEVFLAREEFINNLSIGLNKIVRYSAALRMMFNAEVLPERSSCDIISTMAEDHSSRRNEVIKTIRNCCLLDSTSKLIYPMMIDYLLEVFDEDALREQWHVGPDEPLYPPKHIGYVLNMILLDHPEPKDIARVAAYFLLDIRDVVTEEQKNKLRGDYHSVMQLTAEEEAEVYYLWCLDHGYYNNAMVFLSQPGRLSSYELPWCAAVVVCTAFGMEESVRRLLKRSCPSLLSPLFVKLMSKNRELFSTIVDTSSFLVLSKHEDFLMKFFKACNEEGYLGDFIANSLRRVPPFVVQVLVEFLKQTPCFEFGDWLLAVFSTVGDIKNLEEQYKRMKQIYEGRLLEEQKIRWMLREKVVLNILSSEQGKKNGVLDFIRQCDNTKVVIPTARSLQIVHAQQMPTTPSKSNEDDEGGLFMKARRNQPAHLQRLKHLQTNQINALSPLRRYAARLQSDLRTPRRGGTDTDIEDEKGSDTDTSRIKNLTASTPLPRAMISILNYPNEDDIPVDSYDDSGEVMADGDEANMSQSLIEENLVSSVTKSRQYNRSPSPINLKSLLEPPGVDHRERSMSYVGSTPSFIAGPTPSGLNRSVISTANRSIYFTAGSSVPPADNSIMLHSIMKKRDSTSRRNMELRFLDSSQNSGIEEEEDQEEIDNIFKATSDDEDSNINQAASQSQRDDSKVSRKRVRTPSPEPRLKPTRSPIKTAPVLEKMVKTPRLIPKNRNSPKRNFIPTPCDIEESVLHVEETPPPNLEKQDITVDMFDTEISLQASDDLEYPSPTGAATSILSNTRSDGTIEDSVTKTSGTSSPIRRSTRSRTPLVTPVLLQDPNKPISQPESESNAEVKPKPKRARRSRTPLLDQSIRESQVLPESKDGKKPRSRRATRSKTPVIETVVSLDRAVDNTETYKSVDMAEDNNTEPHKSVDLVETEISMEASDDLEYPTPRDERTSSGRVTSEFSISLLDPNMEDSLMESSGTSPPVRRSTRSGTPSVTAVFSQDQNKPFSQLESESSNVEFKPKRARRSKTPLLDQSICEPEVLPESKVDKKPRSRRATRSKTPVIESVVSSDMAVDNTETHKSVDMFETEISLLASDDLDPTPADEPALPGGTTSELSASVLNPNMDDSVSVMETSGTSSPIRRSTRSRTPSVTAFSVFSQDYKSQPGSESNTEVKPKRARRSKTPLLDQSICESQVLPESIIDKKPRSRRATRSKTPETAVSTETVEDNAETHKSFDMFDSEIELEAGDDFECPTDERNSPGGAASELSKTLMDRTFEDTVMESSGISPPIRRSTRSRTPSATSIFSQDLNKRLLQPESESDAGVKKPKRARRSKTPLLDQSICEPEVLPESKVDNKPRSRRATRSKTPVIESVVSSDMAEDNTEPHKPVTRSRSRIDSHDSSISSSISPTKSDMSICSSVGDESETTKTTRTRKPKRTVRGFAPELSTVAEDLSTDSLNMTKTQTPLVGKVTRSTAKRMSPIE